MDILLEIIRTKAELLTIIISIIGIAICGYHIQFLQRARAEITDRLSWVFATDAAVYVVTMVMGIGLFCDLKWLVVADVIIRPAILLANVFASISLYKCHLEIKEKVND